MERDHKNAATEAEGSGGFTPGPWEVSRGGRNRVISRATWDTVCATLAAADARS